MDTAERILRDFEVIAVVGLSRDPSKPSHTVPKALKAAGFRVIPVNPSVDQLLGERAYHDLAEIPFPVDVVLVFRPSADVPPIAEQAVAIKAKALWLQQGIRSEHARRTAEQAGLLYVEDRCAAVERSVHRITKATHPQ